MLADINFPTHTLCMGEGRPKEYRADGVGIPALLQGILKLMPLDTYADYQVQLNAKRTTLYSLVYII